jgi:hypothetical protein
MTAIDPQLAARVAELGVPLSADWAPSKPLPSHLAAIGQAGSQYEQALYAAYLQAMAEVEQLRGELDVVAKFVAKRAEYITAIENCHPNNDYDYNRWQGHAESRRQLAQQLDLPVAWPANDEEAGR